MSTTKDDLLQQAAAMIRDLLNGWPVKELHRDPEDLLTEIAAAVRKPRRRTSKRR